MDVAEVLAIAQLKSIGLVEVDEVDVVLEHVLVARQEGDVGPVPFVEASHCFIRLVFVKVSVLIELNLFLLLRLASHLKDATLHAAQPDVDVYIVWRCCHLLGEAEVVLLLSALSCWSRWIASPNRALTLSP